MLAKDDIPYKHRLKTYIIASIVLCALSAIILKSWLVFIPAFWPFIIYGQIEFINNTKGGLSFMVSGVVAVGYVALITSLLMKRSILAFYFMVILFSISVLIGSFGCAHFIDDIHT